MCQNPRLGDSVCITGNPFGSFCPEVFFAAQSVGCVSKVLGDYGAVFLTDARCLPGCEGAMVVCGNSPGLRYVIDHFTCDVIIMTSLLTNY